MSAKVKSIKVARLRLNSSPNDAHLYHKTQIRHRQGDKFYSSFLKFFLLTPQRGSAVRLRRTRTPLWEEGRTRVNKSPDLFSLIGTIVGAGDDPMCARQELNLRPSAPQADALSS